MPYTKQQKRLFGYDLGRRKKGLKPITTMTDGQLREGIKSPTKPSSKPAKKRRGA